MRFSWVHPDVAEQARAALRRGRVSWEEVFRGEQVDAGAAPAGVAADVWPRLAEHIARGERVLEVAARNGVAAAERRFGASPHAVERAALLHARDGGSESAGLDEVQGILECAVDEWIAYGQFLSRLVELNANVDPAATVTAFERFVAELEKVKASEPSWPERVRVARDGLAALYVRVGKAQQAEELFQIRLAEEPADTTIAISAARAFLEAGDFARAVHWLETAAARADGVGRVELGRRLHDKASAIRGRLN